MLNKKPLVSYHVNTFNGINLIKNLLLSFEMCNVYDNFEWIITDYGSTDGTREYLLDYSNKNSWLTVLFSSECGYFDYLGGYNLKPKNNYMNKIAIFGKAINDARKIAKGEYFIHLADDHQFIRKCDWVTEMLEISEHRKKKIGHEDISSILLRGLHIERVFKKNNRCHDVELTSSGIEYFVAVEKRYDDYHFMKSSMYEKIGEFLQLEKMKDDKEFLDCWEKQEVTNNHYLDYLDRTAEMNLHKVFLKIPCMVDFPNSQRKILNQKRAKLIAPLVDTEKLKKVFADLNRPVSSDEVLNVANSIV